MWTGRFCKMLFQSTILSIFIPGIFAKSLMSKVTTENPKEMQVAPIIPICLPSAQVVDVPEGF